MVADKDIITEDMGRCSRHVLSRGSSKQTFIVSNDTYFLTMLHSDIKFYSIIFRESEDKCGYSAYHAKEFYNRLW
jgi:hypothetical protein